VRSRHGPATVTESPRALTECESARAHGSFGSQIPAAEEEQTLFAERAHSALCIRAPTRFDPRWSGRGVACLLSTILPS